MSTLAARRVTSQAPSAWIGAALLLFFGFGYMSEPSGTDLFSKAAWVFFQTLRIGGIAMALAAAFLMTGHVVALAIDAVVAIAVGLFLIGTGVVMVVDGGDWTQPLINVLCGSGFVSSGRRSWGAYTHSANREPPIPHTPRPIPPPIESAPLRASNFELPSSPPPAAGYLSALAQKRRKDRDESPS